MTKRKKQHQPTLDELLARPWCYYCERDFDDDGVLISHQKAKHFRCTRCNRRLQTIGGLGVHMHQVHKEKLESVGDALPNRNDIQTEIFAMVGIPEDIKQQHDSRIIREYWAKHQNKAQNGQGQDGNAAKKPKFVNESTGDMLARLAKQREEKAAQRAAAAAGTTENGTPDSASTPNHQQQTPDPAAAQSPATMQSPQADQAMPPGISSMPPGPASPYGFPSWPGPYGHAGSPPGVVPMPYGPPGHMAPAGSPLGVNGYGPPPGLPARPNMAPPHADQFQMQQMHSGAMPTQSRDPRLNRSPMPAGASKANGYQESVTTTSTPGATKAPTSSNKKEKTPRGTKLVFNKEKQGPEETFAGTPKFAVDPAAFDPPTVLGQVEQNVTGPSDSSYDQS